MGEPAGLTQEERAQVEKNLAYIDELGDLVGGWAMKTVQARQKGFTMTITFDNNVGDVFKAQDFAMMMEKCPQLYSGLLRRAIRMDDEIKAREAT